jgi:hypothetical protein
MDQSNLSLEKSLLSTLADSDLQDVARDAGEILIDTLLTDGLLRDIPIVNTVTAVAKTGLGIKEWLFARKVLRFLQPLGKHSPEERRRYLNSLNPDELKKASEYMVLYLDRLDSLDKAAMLSKVFEAYMLQKINHRSMLYFSHFIDSVFILVWEDYYAALKTQHNDLHRGKAISRDDALALEKVGFYEERQEAEKKTARSGDTIAGLKRSLVLTDAGWDFIRLIFQLWPEEEAGACIARARLAVALRATRFTAPFGTF